MTDRPKFIPAKTKYGFGENEPKAPPRTQPEKRKFDPNEMIMGEAGGEILPIKEYHDRISKVPTIRTGDQLTKMDKDELAILRKQMERGGIRDAGLSAVSEDAEKTMIVEPLPPPVLRKKGFFAKIFGK